jgi:hypothetical protein
MIALKNETGNSLLEIFPKFNSSLHELFNGNVSIIKQENHSGVSLSIRIMEPGRYIFSLGKKEWEILVEDAPFFTTKMIGNHTKEIIVTQVTDDEDIFTDIVLLNSL